ncbi:hypothetical protein K402DRAFT_397805 [Aulographum hederae CBS 113979]|uniref:Uncharacterized protein n=1 Tax=Aulographum hederae CBS 113979 TaxID=1176131 RepID=A0A6G1GMM5_9PEZI|nr:hypothetical protein K402DRAFT_397805 [Aulographum hederae CBS 113979]
MTEGGGQRHRLRGGGSDPANMILPTRPFLNDEELGKRDDDHKPGLGSPIRAWIRPWRYRKRRLLTGLLVVVLLWLFIYNIPTDLGPSRVGIRRPMMTKEGLRPLAAGDVVDKTAGTAPPREADDGAAGMESQHYYNGLIKFYKLASSLHAISRTQGYRRVNRNVLFAASNLKSVANLIPLACAMAEADRNYVHMVLLGRDNIPLETIQEINGVNLGTCNIFWHDARPDFAEYSSERRAEATVSAALGHIDGFMHPQVIIMDDSNQEDAFFTRGLRSKASILDHPIIEVPKGRADDFMWISRLEASSLRAWHKATIDIHVHAPAGSSGSLIRMLQSLEAADYAGLSPPRLTIELPADIDPFTKMYLNKMFWPPKDYRHPLQQNQLVVRHRIAHNRVSQEEASIRFLESFYPTSAGDSHVLLLSPQAQLSPLFYQYVKYTLLEYKYATGFNLGIDAQWLAGISLTTPSTWLNGSKVFAVPTLDNMRGENFEDTLHTGPENPNTSPPFLWQAPDSDAALYFGDKWIELHSYLSHRITTHQAATKSKNKPNPKEKLISDSKPGWTEYMLELMRARGYGMLYPGSTHNHEGLPSNTFVTIHDDLYTPPEEFKHSVSERDTNDAEATSPPIPPQDEPFTAPAHPSSVPKSETPEHPLLTQSQPLHAILPFRGALPSLPQLPLLSWNGITLSQDESIGLALDYAEELSVTVGYCLASSDKSRRRKVYAQDARDLFCDGNEEYEDVHPPPQSEKETEEQERLLRAANRGGHGPLGSGEGDSSITRILKVEKGEEGDEESLKEKVERGTKRGPSVGHSMSMGPSGPQVAEPVVEPVAKVVDGEQVPVVGGKKITVEEKEKEKAPVKAKAKDEDEAIPPVKKGKGGVKAKPGPVGKEAGPAEQKAKKDKA